MKLLRDIPGRPELERPLITTLDRPVPAGARYDRDAADRAVAFFRLLPHIKGKWAGTTFELSPWQEWELVRPLFGYKRADGTRLFREAYVEVPRKNGKSTLAAGIAGILMLADREPGPEVYTAAVDKGQAGIVFDTLKAMIGASPELAAKVPVRNRFAMVAPKTSATLKVLSGDKKNKDGLNPSGYVVDEVHAHTDDTLIELLETALGAREQPLGFYITTAGVNDHGSVCWQKHARVEQVASGVLSDPGLLGVIYAAEADDDWKDEATWAKANPGYGDTVGIDYLRRQFAKTEGNPAKENSFRRLHLNQWTGQHVRWMPMDVWDAQGNVQVVDALKLKGHTCYAGIYLAAPTDLAAIVLVFPDEEGAVDILPYFFIPTEGLAQREHRDAVPYLSWEREGLLKTTPGNSIDHVGIRSKFDELARTYEVIEIGHHPYNGIEFMQSLMDEGFTLAAMRPSFGGQTDATQKVMELALAQKLRHGRNPILRWMADSASVKTDSSGSIKLDPSESTANISGLLALVMGLDRYIRSPGWGEANIAVF